MEWWTFQEFKGLFSWKKYPTCTHAQMKLTFEIVDLHHHRDEKAAVRRAEEGMRSIRRSPSTVSDPEIASRTLLPPVFHIQYDQPTSPTGTTEFLCAGAVTYWWPSPSVTQCRNSTSWWSPPLPITTADQRKALCSNDEDGQSLEQQDFQRVLQTGRLDRQTNLTDRHDGNGRPPFMLSYQLPRLLATTLA